jgi:flagellar biosynthesis protein FliR
MFCSLKTMCVWMYRRLNKTILIFFQTRRNEHFMVETFLRSFGCFPIARLVENDGILYNEYRRLDHVWAVPLNGMSLPADSWEGGIKLQSILI